VGKEMENFEMADMLQGSWKGSDGIGYIPPMQDRSAELRTSSRQALPELEAVLNQKGVLFSPDRKYAIFRNMHGSVELRRKKDGFPPISREDVDRHRYEDIPSRQIFYSSSLLILFKRMDRDEDEYPHEWSSQ